MIQSTTHNHSTLCDGKSTLQQMANAAVQAGFQGLGFSGHSYAPFDLQYSIKDEQAYIKAVRNIAQEYAPKLQIYCGLEQEFYAPTQCKNQYDYIIGSVHYMKNAQNKYYSVDANINTAKECIADMFAGDVMAYVQAYYNLVVQNVHTYKPDVIGHFDLVCVSNINNQLFDENSTQYKNIALQAMQACAQTGAIFEINTGAMARGRLARQYPDTFLLQELCKQNIPVTINADCHNADDITCAFDAMQILLKTIGFQQTYQFVGGAFVPVNL